MVVPSLLLLAIGLLGAADIRFFHQRAHHLHDHAPARAELLTHFLRGPTYALLFAGVPNFRFAGGWLLALFAVLAFDVAISIADFWLEPASRAGRGGLPRGEYVLHVVIAMLFGALVAAIAYEAGPALAAPSALHWHDGVPAWLRLGLAAMAVGVFASWLSDLRAARRLAARPQ
ncbi:MAG: hypothetical protein QM775_25090 [Pirellulales bacterium]